MKMEMVREHDDECRKRHVVWMCEMRMADYLLFKTKDIMSYSFVKDEISVARLYLLNQFLDEMEAARASSVKNGSSACAVATRYDRINVLFNFLVYIRTIRNSWIMSDRDVKNFKVIEYSLTALLDSLERDD